MDDKIIKKRTIAGIIWKFLERILAQIVSLVVSIVLARLLLPEDYSVVSIVTIFFTFANVIISGGLNTALIQKKDADADDYSTVLIFSLIGSFIIYILLFVMAPLISRIYNQPLLIPIFRVMGLAMPIYAVKAVWCAYISSNLLFRKFFFATIGGTIVSAIVGIVLALRGAGAWALVAQQMTNAIIDTSILFLTTRIQMRCRFNVSKFKHLFSYGSRVLASNLLGTTYSQISPLIIGLKFSSVDLAFYQKGKSFPDAISTSTTSTLSAVLFPALSKYQDDKEKVLAYTRRYMQLASFVVFPIMIGLFAISDQFVTVILTVKWVEASYYIKLFSICYMFDIVAIGNCETIKAIGRSDVFLKMEVIKKIGYFFVLLLFIFWAKSSRTLAISSALCVCLQIIVNSYPNRKLLNYSYRDQLSDLVPNFVNALLMGAMVYLIGKIGTGIFVMLIQILSGIIIYVLIGLCLKNSSLYFFINGLKQVAFNRKERA